MITQEQLDAWKAALRSGEWKQCRNAFSNQRNEHCCLDVLIRLNGFKPVKCAGHETFIKTLIGTKVRERLISINDVQRKTFSEIADWLDTQTPESLAR